MAAYVLGTGDGVAVPAVVGSQFAAVAAVAGFVFYGERLRRVQLAGVGTILVGVAVLSAVQSG
jgi:multidrug transporter EmrE-like cation transporter